MESPSEGAIGGLGGILSTRLFPALIPCRP